MIISLFIIPITILNLNDALKIFFGLIFLLFIPGYLILYTLFPTKKINKGINFIERIALSFGISLAIVALIGIALYYLAGKINSESALISIFIFEMSFGFISIYRWYKTIPEERLIFSINLSLFELKNNLKIKSKLDKLLIMILIILIIFTITIFIFIITSPIQHEKYTSFNLLSSDRSTTNYPNNIIAGENTTIIIGITNHEYKTINYTVEIWLINQTINFNKTTNENIITYNNAWFMDKINVTLKHTNKKIDKEWESQWEYNYTFNITKKGENLTLVFLLFNTSTDIYYPSIDYKDIIEQKIDKSYEGLHIWITVE
jgi:uncharacterized membrane protein